MMAREPLRSATATGSAEDTSLAVPSDNKRGSRQQRVLEQVHSIKRSKSKQGRNGTMSSSPTSPNPQMGTVDGEFRSFKFSPFKANGTFSRTTSTLTTANGKSATSKKFRSQSTKVPSGKYRTSGTEDWQMNNWRQSSNGLKPSRSDPNLVFPFSPGQASIMRPKGQMVQNQNTLQTRVNRYSVSSATNGKPMTNSQTRFVRSLSAQSQNDSKMGTVKTSKLEQKSAVSTAMSFTDLTLNEAVEYLSSADENYQRRGATFIQYASFNEESVKPEVLKLNGIGPLVTLLESANPSVSQAAAGALRNLVFKDRNNKLKVQHFGGIAKALRLLKETNSTETQKQIAGLLWNLSSANELKQELMSTALPALTENVIVPFTSWSDSTATSHIDPAVFYCSTGCLRNLSSGQQSDRQTMRKIPSLIDSLMSYVQSCVAEENPDDKSVENCACILQNLSYQLEEMLPESFKDYQPHRGDSSDSKKSPVGCFSPRSSKAQNEFPFDVSRGMLEDCAPSGVSWLCHPRALSAYMSLLGSSQKDTTLEACSGALQNLTASKKVGSQVVSQVLVHKLDALFTLAVLMKSTNPTLQKNVMCLLSNMSQTSSLQTTMAKQILPELTGLLSLGASHMGKNDDTMAAANNVARRLIMADTEFGKKHISSEMINSVSHFSEDHGTFPKAKKAASVLLFSLWNGKNLQSHLKKLGLGRTDFLKNLIADVD